MKKKNNNDINNNMKNSQRSANNIGSNKAKSKIEYIGNNNNAKEEQTSILRIGYLEKKNPLFHYNKRRVVLYSTPKLVYIDGD